MVKAQNAGWRSKQTIPQTHSEIKFLFQTEPNTIHSNILIQTGNSSALEMLPHQKHEFVETNLPLSHGRDKNRQKGDSSHSSEV